VFGIDSDLEVPAYSEVDPHVPDVDSDYRFDRAAGFCRPLLSARFAPAPIRSQAANLVSGAPETSED